MKKPFPSVVRTTSQERHFLVATQLAIIANASRRLTRLASGNFDIQTIERIGAATLALSRLRFHLEGLAYADGLYGADVYAGDFNSKETDGADAFGAD